MTTQFTHHGGRLAHACALFGGSREDWLDLSTGINPNAWMPPPKLTVDWKRLPDPEELAALEAQAAQHFGCAPDLCAAVPGSETALRLLARILNLPGLHTVPCYGTYRAAFERTQSFATSDVLPPRPTVMTIGNPNNPDGVTPSHASLITILEHQEQHDGWLIVDEAFADCDPATSTVPFVSDSRSLIVLRSFGKFFGLAGIRIGFVIGPRGLLDRIRHLLGDWPLHAAALSIGTAAYADKAWIMQTRRDLAENCALLDAMLSHHGIEGRGDCPLFRLVETSGADILFERLARQFILTRPFSQFPRLLRIGVPGTQPALDRLARALG